MHISCIFVCQVIYRISIAIIMMSTSLNTVASESGPIRAQDYVNVGDTLFMDLQKINIL